MACVVKPFTYTPNHTGQKGMGAEDWARWQEILTGGLNQSNIFADVVAQKSDPIPENVAYSVEGKVTRFYFKKNWGGSLTLSKLPHPFMQ
ncbi:MAG: hypothetical protein HY731_01130 [Candidatus Tectomicrobia bacterium]|nr:hypothetical protein [Candidatus Tectomicrobia bacterium]